MFTIPEQGRMFKNLSRSVKLMKYTSYVWDNSSINRYIVEKNVSHNSLRKKNMLKLNLNKKDVRMHRQIFLYWYFPTEAMKNKKTQKKTQSENLKKKQWKIKIRLHYTYQNKRKTNGKNKFYLKNDKQY